MNDQKEMTAVPVQEPEKKPKKAKKEKEFRRVKTISPMSVVIPFIMVDRTGSQNFIQDSVEIEKLEKYMKEKQQGGMTNISMMHIMIAAYIRQSGFFADDPIQRAFMQRHFADAWAQAASPADHT